MYKAASLELQLFGQFGLVARAPRLDAVVLDRSSDPSFPAAVTTYTTFSHPESSSLSLIKPKQGVKTTLILLQTNSTKEWGLRGGMATKAVVTSHPHQAPLKHGERDLEHAHVVRLLARFLAADLRPGRSRLPRSRRRQSTPRSECLD